MEIEDVMKEGGKGRAITLWVYKRDVDFIRKNKINASKLFRESLRELRKKIEKGSGA